MNGCYMASWQPTLAIPTMCQALFQNVVCSHQHKLQGPVQNKNTEILVQILFRTNIRVTVTSEHWIKHGALVS